MVIGGGQPSAVRSTPASTSGDDFETPSIETEVVEAADESGGPTPIERARVAKVVRQPKVLELDLKTGSVPLRQYLEDKNPTTDNRRYLLIAAWMKANLSLNDVTIDHIYTAYRHMGWASQRDIGSPLRRMKTRNGWFGNGKEKGSYAINHIGFDVAERTKGE